MLKKLGRLPVVMITLLFLVACSSAPGYNNNPDDQRSRRDSAIGELDTNTR